MVDRTREAVLNVRFTDEEKAMIRAVAEHNGLSVSDMVRQLVRRAFAQAFPGEKPKKKR